MCFRITLSNPLELIFYGFSLLQLYRAYQLTRVISNEWQSIQQAPLTRRKMALAEQAAFFIAVPPSIFVHELFHAIPIWLFGGHVIRCGYGFYWGFVQADRFFAPSQEWLISLGGTLGSLLFGFVLWAILRQHPSRSLRYFGLRALRFQIIFSLVYYPLFTAFTFIGDWRTIYNFGSTPILSGATLVAHLLSLAWYWWHERQGGYEMVGHDSVATEMQFSRWQPEPNDMDAQLEYIRTLRLGGAPRLAKVALDRFLQANPHSAEANLQLALLQVGRKSTFPRRAVRRAETALSLGLSRSDDLATAHQMLGQYALDRGKNETAVSHFSGALAAIQNVTIESQQNQLYQARLFYSRCQAYRRQRKYELAIQDMQQALDLVTAVAHDPFIQQYRQELATIYSQAGRSQFP